MFYDHLVTRAHPYHTFFIHASQDLSIGRGVLHEQLDLVLWGWQAVRYDGCPWASVRQASSDGERRDRRSQGSTIGCSSRLHNNSQS